MCRDLGSERCVKEYRSRRQKLGQRKEERSYAEVLLQLTIWGYPIPPREDFFSSLSFHANRRFFDPDSMLAGYQNDCISQIKNPAKQQGIW